MKLQCGYIAYRAVVAELKDISSCDQRNLAACRLGDFVADINLCNAQRFSIDLADVKTEPLELVRAGLQPNVFSAYSEIAIDQLFLVKFRFNRVIGDLLGKLV